jgi:hypothetical protein
VELDSSRRVELEDYIDVGGHLATSAPLSRRKLIRGSWCRDSVQGQPLVPRVARPPRL